MSVNFPKKINQLLDLILKNEKSLNLKRTNSKVLTCIGDPTCKPVHHCKLRTNSKVLKSRARKSINGFPLREELRPRLNRRLIGDPTTCKLRMEDVAELTPALLDKSLTEY